MRALHLLFLLTFFILSPTLASAQEDTHVHVRRSSDSDTTVVRTDWMYLINTPQRFMQLILNASYKGQRLQTPPDKVDLVIRSYSREIKDRGNKRSRLLVKTDGESWDVLSQTHLVYRGETKNGQSVFWEEKRVAVGQPGSLPENARIKDGDGINGIFMEQVFFQLKPEQLLKIATAKSVELQLEETKFGLLVDYQNIVRSFLRRIDSSSQGDQERATAPPQSASPQEQKAAGKTEAEVINGKAISLPRPAYPLDAKNANASGAVKVLVTIDETGKVIAAQAISGHPLLRSPAEQAAQAARFSPTSVSGRAVKVTGILLYNFLP